MLQHPSPFLVLSGALVLAGSANQVLGASTDITRRKETETELREQRAELAHVARISTMGELAASLAGLEGAAPRVDARIVSAHLEPAALGVAGVHGAVEVSGHDELRNFAAKAGAEAEKTAGVGRQGLLVGTQPRGRPTRDGRFRQPG